MFYDIDKRKKLKEIEENIIKITNMLNLTTSILVMINNGNEHIEIIHSKDKDETQLNEVENEILINIKKHLQNENYKKSKTYFINSNESLINNMETEICIPLYLGNDKSQRIIGTLYLASKKKHKIKKLDENILKISNIISNDLNMLYLEEKFKSIFNITIGLVTKIAEEKETYDESHPYNVSYFSVLVSKELGFSEKRILNLQIASMLHDVGKVFLLDNILNKKSKFTKEEFEHIKKHSIYSYNIVNEFTGLLDGKINIANIVRWHHENYDGTGYPDGLKKDEIPLESKIIRVCDSIDAMVSKRVYKKTKSFKDSIIDLKKNSNTLYDPKVVEAAIKVLNKIKDSKDLEIINNFGISSNLNIYLDKDMINLKGAFRKEGNGYVFSSYKENIENLIKDKAIKYIEIYTDVNHTIYEYNVKTEKIKNNSVYIKELKHLKQANSFGLSWDLNGIIVKNRKETYNIQIKYLSGDFLQFHTNNMDIKDIRDMKNIIIIFEDGNKIIVSGEIVKYYNTPKNHHYKFKYIGINEGTKDKIFSELFSKQRNSNTSIPLSLKK